MKYDYTEDSVESCPFSKIQKVVQGKWTMVIIYFLSIETLRFSQLKRKIPNITEANLTKELRLLEKYGLVHREIYRQVPPRVEYSLTDIGRQFIPVLDALKDFSSYYEKYTLGQN